MPCASGAHSLGQSVPALAGANRHSYTGPFFAINGEHLMTFLHRLLRSAECPLPVSAAHTVLLVTAHPDDETLFFLPALQGLQAAGARITVLCLSTGDSPSAIFAELHTLLCISSVWVRIGNAEGLGVVRREELRAACRVLSVSTYYRLR